MSQPNTNRQVINVDFVADHPDYNSRRISDDISLLHLETPATLTSYVQPACRPDDNLDYDTFMGTVSGWGRIRNSKIFVLLVSLSLIPLLPTVNVFLLFYRWPIP